MSRINELEQKIFKARNDYYNSIPTVTDEVYDAWTDELAELQMNNQAVIAIGAPAVSEWPKVTHQSPMGSLTKVNLPTELETWVKNLQRHGAEELLVASEKMDGISIELSYEDGNLVQASTRGDGFIGEDITPNVVRMKGVVKKLPDQYTGSVRGEIVLRKEDLAKHFQGYSSTRNTAAGTAKRFDGMKCEHLSVYCYKISDDETIKTETSMFKKLESWGFHTPNWSTTSLSSKISPQTLWQQYQDKLRDKLPYDIDGLVISLDDLEYQLSLGDQDNRPLGSTAFKFAPIMRETTLRAIEWQVGTIGRITPVATFDAVHLLGANVTNASLYNLSYIKTLGLDIGAKILVARVGDVIPRVVSLVQGTGTVAQPPTLCPACGTLIIHEGEYLTCPNVSGCPAHAAGRIKQWIGEQNILEWGGVLIETVVSKLGVKSVADLYRLTKQQLMNLDRMGDRSSDVILETLHAVNNVSLEHFLGGLSIPNVATSTIRFCIDAGLDTLDKIRSADMDRLMKVPGLGPIKAQAIHTWVRENSTVIDDLLTVISIKEKIMGNMTGKSVCFTGSMQHKRAELEKMVIDAGGVTKSAVCKGLSYLVIADPNSTSSKAQAARKNGTTCISEDMLLSML